MEFDKLEFDKNDAIAEIFVANNTTAITGKISNLQYSLSSYNRIFFRLFRREGTSGSWSTVTTANYEPPTGIANFLVHNFDFGQNIMWYYYITVGVSFTGSGGDLQFYEFNTPIVQLPKQIRNPPPAPTSSNLTFNSVTITGGTGQSVRLGTSGTLYSNSRNFTGLSSNTSYSFYAVYDETSTTLQSGNSSARTITTLVAPPNTPTGLNIISYFEGGIRIGWNSVSGATGYRYRFRLSGGTYGSGISVGTNLSVNVSSLGYGSLYDFQVQAFNSSGDSSWSSSVSGYVRPQTPTINSATNVTHSSATLRAFTVSGVVNFVVFSYRKGSGSWTNVFSDSYNVNITNLDASSSYEYYARTYISAGGGIYSLSNSSSSFFTTQSAPLLEQNTLNLVGDFGSHTFGTTRTFSVSGGSGTGSVSYEITSGNATVNSSTGVVTPTSGTGTYSIRATKSGDSTYLSKSTSIVTINLSKAERSAPSQPSSVSWESNILTTTATVALVSGATHYRVNGGVGQTSRVFSGLNPVTSYSFTCYIASDSNYNDSPDSVARVSTSPKANQSAPSIPTYINLTSSSITVISSGNKVRLGVSGVLHNSPHTFSGLTPETSYMFYAVKSETSTLFESPNSSALVISTLETGRPLNWLDWDDVIFSGAEVSLVVGKDIYIMPALQWNSFTDRVNEFRYYVGLGIYSFTNVSSGDEVSLSVINEVLNALRDMNGYFTGGNSIPSNRVIGDNILDSALYLSMKNALNSIN